MVDATVNILLVEDDDIDAEAIQRAFKKYRIANPLTRVADGIEALKFLRGEGVEQLTRPYIVLLDLNMPRMNGIEFLQELRRDVKLTDSVVFILTTSNDERDKTAAYSEHVSGYIVKSQVGEDFTRLIELMDCYWRVVELPPTRIQSITDEIPAATG
jgi:CheY-like chemotaxis protein